MEGQGRSRKVMDGLFPSLDWHFRWEKLLVGWGGWPVGLYCQPQSHSLSSGLLILDLSLGFGTWIWDLDLGLGFGTGLGLDNWSLLLNPENGHCTCDTMIVGSLGDSLNNVLRPALSTRTAFQHYIVLNTKQIFWTEHWKYFREVFHGLTNWMKTAEE